MTIDFNKLVATFENVQEFFARVRERRQDVECLFLPNMSNAQAEAHCQTLPVDTAFVFVTAEDMALAEATGVLPMGFGVSGTDDGDVIVEVGDILAEALEMFSDFMYRWDGNPGTKILIAADGESFALQGARKSPPPAHAEKLPCSTARYSAHVWALDGEWVYDVRDESVAFSLERGRSRSREACIRNAAETIAYVEAGMDA